MLNARLVKKTCSSGSAFENCHTVFESMCKRVLLPRWLFPVKKKKKKKEEGRVFFSVILSAEGLRREGERIIDRCKSPGARPAFPLLQPLPPSSLAPRVRSICSATATCSSSLSFLLPCVWTQYSDAESFQCVNTWMRAVHHGKSLVKERN